MSGYEPMTDYEEGWNAGWNAGYNDGEFERIALAQANSALRSELLQLKQIYQAVTHG